MSLKLLPREALVRTSAVDHADWNYHPFLGQVQRIRFRLIRSLLGTDRYHRLLEIGYGSGVLIPELKTRSDEIYGIDPHQHHKEVEASLARHGIKAELHSSGAEQLPFPDAFFDCLVSVSALEYVEDIERACREMRRVLKPGGYLVLVTPGQSPLLDFGLRLFTGENADQYGDRRQKLVPTLKRHFAPVKERSVPWVTGSLFRLYTGLKLRT
jgi:ubiquinone/menaquinone biosynthesis C-methylase UbiE